MTKFQTTVFNPESADFADGHLTPRVETADRVKREMTTDPEDV